MFGLKIVGNNDIPVLGFAGCHLRQNGKAQVRPGNQPRYPKDAIEGFIGHSAMGLLCPPARKLKTFPGKIKTMNPLSRERQWVNGANDVKQKKARQQKKQKQTKVKKNHICSNVSHTRPAAAGLFWKTRQQVVDAL